MSYKSELNRFKETFGNSLSLLTLDIAMEVEDAIGRNELEISDEGYENVCDYVYQLYMKDQTEKSVYKLVEKVFEYIIEDGEENNSRNLKCLFDFYSPREFLDKIEEMEG